MIDKHYYQYLRFMHYARIIWCFCLYQSINNCKQCRIAIGKHSIAKLTYGNLTDFIALIIRDLLTSTSSFSSEYTKARSTNTSVCECVIQVLFLSKSRRTFFPLQIPVFWTKHSYYEPRENNTCHQLYHFVKSWSFLSADERHA